MRSRFLAGLRRQWMGAVALFLVVAGGTAYAANTVTSADIVDGQVKAPDLGLSSVRGGKVANENLTGRDIANQSGVDTCVSTVRLGQLCVRAENLARPWLDAVLHCANLDLRMPSFAEAQELARTHDIPNVTTEFFWTDERFESGGTFSAYVVNEAGSFSTFGLQTNQETVCVTTPTN